MKKMETRLDYCVAVQYNLLSVNNQGDRKWVY